MLDLQLIARPDQPDVTAVLVAYNWLVDDTDPEHARAVLDGLLAGCSKVARVALDRNVPDLIEAAARSAFDACNTSRTVVAENCEAEAVAQIDEACWFVHQALATRTTVVAA